MSKFHNKAIYRYEKTFAKQNEPFIHFFFIYLCEGNNRNAGYIPTEMGKLNMCKTLILRKF